MLERIRFV
uniref:Uncharacterized protein n=1 Tax=Rhizophora mucronata TaxID=61149 RepID=A0A2P2PEB7_RHIMU